MDASRGQRSVSAQGLLGLEAFMRSRGLDYRRAARDVGIDPTVAQDIEARVPLHSVAQLIENVARETGNDAFGAQLGTTFRIGTMGTLDYVISNAPTLRAALHDYVRFLALVTDGLDTRFDEGPRTGYLVTRLPAAFAPKVQLIDTALAARVVRIRHIMRDPALPILVELERSKPKSIGEFVHIFGPRVRFEQAENRIGIASRALDRELPAADPQLYKVVVQAAKKALAERENADDMMFRLISCISSSLPHGEVRITATAQALGLSVHELRRHLAGVGTTFRDLLDETRRSMADHHINETALPMTEIAFLLGFSELSAFSRAARKWFGRTPRELRRQARLSA